MNTETLPKTWAINVRDYRHDNTLLINFKEWYCNKANESFRFTSNYYGMSGDGEFSNYDVYNKRFTIITLEQWDAAVNKKGENLKSKIDTFPIFNIANFTKYHNDIFTSHSILKPPKDEGRVGWDNKKVMGKRVESENNPISPADIINELSPPNHLNPFIVNKVNIFPPSQTSNLISGSIAVDSKCHETKQPKLKIGDKIPEYLDRKLSYLTDGYQSWAQKFCALGYSIVAISDSNYCVNHIHCETIIYLKISEVDALIEEHEREMKLFGRTVTSVMVNYENVGFSKNGDMIELNEEIKKEEWIPKNGE
jgi:hypothetical protein